MPNLTKENRELFEEKLKYIGLDLDNIPEFLKDFKALDYRPTKRFDNTEYMVYRFVPVNKIQILITETNRLTDIKEKYEKAKPISEYLNMENEKHIEDVAIFLSMLKNTEISEIEEVKKKQEELNSELPYNIKYEKNYMWQIYYSEYTDQYFMLVPSNDAEFGAFFYLLKEQIEANKNNVNDKYIYVPVSNIEPNEEILRRNERIDLENYLWIFTKNWPNIFELQLKTGTKKIVIVGETEVYPSIFAKYHIELDGREEASDFYKKIKALFILQTELHEHYSFKTQIDENGELEFYCKNKKMNYSDLGEFIKNEFFDAKASINRMKEENIELSNKLNELKKEEKEKEAEFIEKQKEISTYLQYKKTFFGKVKYFFSRKKKIKRKTVEEEQETVEESKKEELKLEEKKTYTIEDLVTMYATYNKIEDEKKNKRLDVNALELKVKNLSKKIENATLFINEIDSHKRSIFEFWRFSSKDEVLALNNGEEEEEENQNKTLRRVFDYESDRDDITKQLDKIQREKLSKEEEDSIFVLNSEILPVINKLKTLVKVNDEKVVELIEELKDGEKKEKEKNNTEYDIFGSLLDDRTKIKTLGKNKHRETEKNKYQILGINSDTTLQEFKETLKKVEETARRSFVKIENIIDMPIYKVVPAHEKIDLYGFEIYSINADEELQNSKINEEECNLIKVNIKENMPAIFYTNIMYFDNYNKTLPLGMDKSNELVIDSDMYSFILRDKKTVYTNKYFTKKIDAHKLINRKINIYEYDAEIKRRETKNDQ